MGAAWPELRRVMREGSRIVGRYAPSPTGDLHPGNLRTALEAWRWVRQRNGVFLLRLEDIDTPRTVPGSETRILEDLHWLGIDWDEGPDRGGPAGPYRQSERTEVYEVALSRLRRAGLTYLCTCSRRDLREASAPHGPEGPIYPGTCRGTDRHRQRRHPNGAAERLRVDRVGPIEFHDLIVGRQWFDLERLCGDFIVRRRDRLWAYQLACAVDDALMGVTHVLRGADLVTSTPRQIAVIRMLGFEEPLYGHLPLVADPAGRRMCKRGGSQSIRNWRQAGMHPAEARDRIMRMPLLAPEPGRPD